MRVRLFGIVACVLAVFATPAAAVFSPSLFYDLKAELTRRRDQDLAGTLAKREKRQLSAVLSAIAAVAKPATYLTYDVKVARSTQAALAKAYPDEFGGATGPTQLEPLYQGLFDGLTAALQTDRTPLDDWRLSLDPKSGKRIGAQLAVADKAFAAHAALSPTDFKRRGKQLASAASALAKATAILDKAPPSGLHAQVNGQPWASSAAVTYIFGDNTVYFVGSRDVAGGTREVIELFVSPVSGPGTYPLDASFRLRGGFRTEPLSGTPTVRSIVPGTGSLTVERFDIRNRVRLHFSFTAGDAGTGTRAITHATLDVGRDAVTIQAGNAF